MSIIELRGIDELIRGIGALGSEQLPFAMAKTLTDIAWIAKRNTVEEMKQVFDRPNPFTLNSLQIDRATKENLKSRVWFKSPSRVNNNAHYLTPQVEGGSRAFKKFEAALKAAGVLPAGYYIIPASGAEIDSYGNQTKGQIIQIMSFFSAFGEQGYQSNMNSANRDRLWRGTRRRAGISYFSIQPGTNSGLKPGIYKRINSNFGYAIKPVMLFVRSVRYRKILDIKRIGDETYNTNFEEKFATNFRSAVESALPR